MLTSRKSVVWEERLRRFERSGLTVAKFCRQEGVSVPSFYQWRKRLAEAAAGSRRSTPAFQQVMLAGSVVAIELPSGVRVELPAQQLQLVRAVVAELLQAESASLRGDA